MRGWLRVEGLAFFIAAVATFAQGVASWWLFALLFFVPDLSFAAYAAGPRAGAIVYNALHSYVAPVLWLAIGFLLLDSSLAIPLIWIAHIGFDRMLGYGLKYPTAFQETHLGRIGRGRKAVGRG